VSYAGPAASAPASTTAVGAGLLVAAAVLVGGTCRRRSLLRLRSVVQPGHRPRSGVSRPRLGAAVAVALAAIWCTGGWPGIGLAGAAVALLAARRRRRLRTVVVGVAEAALFTDLLAAYLAGGARPASAVRQAARSSPNLARLGADIAAGLDAGLPPDEAWLPAIEQPALAAAGRVCARAAATGSASGDELRRLAARLRQQRERQSEQLAARAGIWLVLPLGACFLPAFVLLTVVPVVAGLLPALP
jgi:hypothetical protein